ncbi:winged helix-turn-helix transcriptional regulator [Amycolatopsis thermoflava]|uniref:winged helix-turn-helix transcriptional regulator n=1 Tax=Amycolatopsis thermoflava TaxID=84480 RepID=UPI003EB91120
MALGKDYATQDCSLARALEVVGERWTLLVLRDFFYGVRRFGDLCAHLDIPRAVLTDRLKSLVAAGLLERRPRPSGHEYVLTERGIALWPAVFALAQWGEHEFGPPAGPRRVFSHADCGTAVTESGLCPRCRTIPGPADLMVSLGPGAKPGLRDDPVSVALREPHRLLTPLA